MSYNKKIWLGVFTFLPVLLFILYFICIFGFVGLTILQTSPEAADVDPTPMIGGLILSMIFILLSVFIALGMMIYYIVHAANDKEIDSTQRLVLILILIFASGIGSMVYWYMQIWHTPPVFKAPNMRTN